MSTARILQKITTVVSSDIDQQDTVHDGSEILDDTSQSKTGTTYTVLDPGGVFAPVPLPMGITRIGWLHIETDAPILCRLNGDGDGFPISPLIIPSLVSGFFRGPSRIPPTVQKGVLSLRSGVNADGNTVYLTTVELRSPTYPATVKVTVVGE